MKIEYVDDSVKFCDVAQGQVFIADGVVYMKTSHISYLDEDGCKCNHNAIGLRYGEFEYIDENQDVVVYPDAFLSI